MTDMYKNRKPDDPKVVRSQLAKAESFNNSLDFYDMCRKNNRFYHGDQWLGMKTTKIQLMTSNFLQRPVSYFVSQIVSDDIGFELSPMIPGSVVDEAIDALPDLVERVFHRNDFRNLNRDVIKQAAIECEGVVHWFFDETVETSQLSRGDIRCERLPTVNVLFGNPYSNSIQDQPYILIKRRVPVEQMRERARLMGCTQADEIKADSDSQRMAGMERTPDQERVTEILKYWKVTKSEKRKLADGTEDEHTKTTVHFCRIVGDIAVQKDTACRYSLYPIARMLWNPQDGRYHGSCAITSFIPTQITVNRMLTLVCEYIKNFGLPKVFYKQQSFPHGFRADPTRAYAVSEDPNLAVYQIGAAADVPAGIINLLDKLVETSRDFMGTSDAALGNIRPDNTSAIVAVQKATAAPLMLQTMQFYQYVRDCIRIVIDQIGAFYGKRLIRYEQDDAGTDIPLYIDFDAINIDEMDLTVDVGAASYWSELTAIQTIDNLVGAGFLDLSDPEQKLLYLDIVPKKYIPDRAKLVKFFEDRAKAAQNQQQLAAFADELTMQQQLAGIDTQNASADTAALAPEPGTAEQSIARASANAKNPSVTSQQARDAAEIMTRGGA